jgi:hypothetical protein
MRKEKAIELGKQGICKDSKVSYGTQLCIERLWTEMLLINPLISVRISISFPQTSHKERKQTCHPSRTQFLAVLWKSSATGICPVTGRPALSRERPLVWGLWPKMVSWLWRFLILPHECLLPGEVGPGATRGNSLWRVYSFSPSLTWKAG